MPKYSYHFDLGNSTDGPIGYCARIEAGSKAEAVARLRDLLPEAVEDVNPCDELTGGEYIHVYFNYEQHPTEADIDDIEDEDGNYLDEDEYSEDEDSAEEPENVATRVAAILGVSRGDK